MSPRRTIVLGGTARSAADVEALGAMGLPYAEVAITRPERFVEEVSPFREAGRRAGVRFLCHGPREGDPNDLETLEGVYLPKVLGTISLMPSLDMRILTVHLWMDARFVKPASLRYKTDLLRRLTEAAAPGGITVCLENLSEQAEHLSDLLKQVPALMLTLDLGHGELLAERNAGFDIMDRFPDRIRHIHLHDNRGGRSPSDDLHLPVGQGEIDFKALFYALCVSGYQGTMTLELRPREIEACLPVVERLLAEAGFRRSRGEENPSGARRGGRG